MKKAHLFLVLMLISTAIFSQEMRFILKDRSAGDFEKVYDTIWQVKKVYTKLGESNQIIYDTVWERMNKKKLSVRDLSGNSNDQITSVLFDKGKGFVGVSAQSALGSSIGLEGIKIGYFVSENRLLGGSGQIRLGDNTGINLSAFYRSYFGKSETGRAWAELNTSIVASEGSSTGGFGLGVGYTSMFTRAVGIDFGLNYQKLGKLKGELVLNLGFALVIGR